MLKLLYMRKKSIKKKRGGTFVSPFSGVSFPSKSTVLRLVTKFATVILKEKKLERTRPAFFLKNRKR